MEKGLIVKDENYQALVDEIKATITEAVHNSRWFLVEGYWTVGKLIREEFATRKEIYGKKIAQDLEQSVGVSERTINYACAAYDKYPDLQKLPEGKNISWNKLITKYLPQPKEDASPLTEAQKAAFKKQVRQGDCIEKMKKLPDKSIDMIYVDPPYGVGKDEWDTFEEGEFLPFTLSWIKEYLRLLKDKSHFFIHFPSQKAAWLEGLILEEFSILPVSRVIWANRSLPMGRDASDRFLSTYQPILHYNLGGKPLNFTPEWTDERFDVWTIAIPQTNYKDKKLHITQKPLELMDRLIRYGSLKGELILDPMAGSGTTGVACIKNDRDFILIERESKYVDIIHKRLNR